MKKPNKNPETKHKIFRERILAVLRKESPLTSREIKDRLFDQQQKNGNRYKRNPTMSELNNILCSYKPFARSGTGVHASITSGNYLYKVNLWCIQEC
tara:strand:- start:32 stop:322 length:291 start_codon:yes stop_codon:yes gene_type:complete